MQTILYIYKKCSTCKEALNFLKEQDYSFIEKEITTTPPSIPELELMLKQVHGEVKKLFNTSGILYRELSLSEKLKTMTIPQALELLTRNGMLVKRPFLLGEDFGLVGFNKKTWKEKLTNVK